MALMGIGVGTLIQNVVLAVQNTVDVREVGAASAAISFFRSLGGAIGVSAPGAILTNQVAAQIRDRLSEMGIASDQFGGGSGETNLDLSGLPAPIRQVIHDSYSDAFGHMFLITAAIGLITVVAVVAVRESRLRSTVELQPSPPVDRVDPAQAPAES